MPTFNAKLARKVLEHIKANPDSWKQETWHCGTTACFAGHTALLAGWKWYARTSRSEWEDSTYYVIKDDVPLMVPDAAIRELTGIDSGYFQSDDDEYVMWHDTCDLFSANNTLADLEAKIAELEEKYPPPDEAPAA